MKARTLTCMILAVALLALAPAGALAATGYVANMFDNTVSVFDSVTHAVSTPIPVGNAPQRVAVSHDGTRAYVTNEGDDTVSVIATVSNTVTRTITLNPGDGPLGVAISPDDGTLYVSADGADALDIIDLSDDSITTADLSGGCGCLSEVGVAPNGNTVYVLDSGGIGVWFIDPTASPPTANLVSLPGSFLMGMAVSPATGRLFVTDDYLAEAFVIEPNGTVLPGTIALGTPGDDSPALLAFDPSGAHAWVANAPTFSPTTLAWSIDASTLTATASAAAIPIQDTFGVALPPDGSGVFLTSPLENEVIELNPSTGARVGAPIPVGDTPQGIAFQPPAVTPPVPVLVFARPVVTDVSPRSGPVTGGQKVTIRGANFGSARQVLFGDTPASTVEVVDFNTIVVTAPPGLAGDVDVVVIGPGGASIKVSTFHYEPEPVPVPVPVPATPVLPLTLPDCVVPDVRGLSLTGAKTRLAAANCIVGFTSRVRGRSNQIVKRQSLTPGTHKPYRWGVALALGPKTR